MNLTIITDTPSAKLAFYDAAFSYYTPTPVCFVQDPKTQELFLGVELKNVNATAPTPSILLNDKGLQALVAYADSRANGNDVLEHNREDLRAAVENYKPFFNEAAKLLAESKKGNYQLINTADAFTGWASYMMHARYRSLIGTHYVIPTKDQNPVYVERPAAHRMSA